jgi:hypothetical protein
VRRAQTFARDYGRCYSVDMRQALRLHPDSRCLSATRIEVDVARPRPGSLLLHYFVTGKIGDLRMPRAAAPAHTDELWRHTCFEAFIRASPGAAYYEFNFAPSTQWAAYRFGAYRDKITVASEVSAPRIEVRSSGELYELQASMVLAGISDLPSDAAWRLGLSAVIEETSGSKSHWALAHPPGKADFHHADGFAYELPAVPPP